MPDPSTTQETGRPEKTKTLLIEFALPTFYADDIPGLIAEFGGDEPMGDQILREIGEVNFGALTIQVIGEKDGEVITVPVVARTARIEDQPPNPPEWLEEATTRLLIEARESEVEAAYDQGYDEGMKYAQETADAN